jgi:CRP-like cAMP-binding protein
MAGTNVLALEGLLVREVIVADEVAAEIVGPGDVVPVAADEHRLVPSAVRWTAIMPARLAVLGTRFDSTLLRYPEVALTLLDRQRQRAERLVTLQAVSRLKGVERKVLALMWLLADRWGRMTGEGVVVPVTLQHSVMANLVGARRPTVSSAIGRLQRRGALGRRDDGAWILHERPEALRSEMLDRVNRPRGRILRAIEPGFGGDAAILAMPHKRRLARLEQRAALAREDALRVMRELEATRAAALPTLDAVDERLSATSSG